MAYEFEPACRRMEWLDSFYKQVWEKAYKDAIPISGTFELTPRCNFNCKMCYVHLKENQISKYGKELCADEWLRIAREAKEAGTTWLCLTGGEPLLHPEFEKIYKELARMGFFITLQTNGSLIPQYKELLENYPPRGVKITLYGVTDETYKKVCGIKKGFTKVNQGIQLLKQMHIPVQLVSTIINQNINELKNISLYAMYYQIPWVFTSGIKASLRGVDTKIDEIRVQEKNDQALKKQIRHYIKNPINIERKPCTYCKDYRLGYWITWDGKMRFCSFLDQPNISIKNFNFNDAWIQLVKFEDGLKWPQNCYNCEANTVCFKCIASIATDSGSINKVNIEYCKKIKDYYKTIIKEE